MSDPAFRTPLPFSAAPDGAAGTGSRRARQRAAAQLALLSATCVACMHEWSRFEISLRENGLVLNTIEPDGLSSPHVITVGRYSVDDLEAIAQQINGFGRDPETGRSLLCPVQPTAGASAREYVSCHTRVEYRPAGPVVHLALPMVVRHYPDGTTHVYRPVPLRRTEDEPTWAQF